MEFFSKLARWSGVGAGQPPTSSTGRQRWLVIDVETTGLDAQSAHLLAIAGVGLQADFSAQSLVLQPHDSFEVTLKHEAKAIDRGNILLHGIGIEQQRTGTDPAEALQAFSSWVGSANLLAFHASFDRALIGRHLAQHLGAAAAKPLQHDARWLCIEQLCAATQPKSKARSLDEWMLEFDLHCAQRHQAAADALVEAQVLQRIWPQVLQQASSWSHMQRLARDAQWLRR
jgi:DNA polymerase III subunit epsilon